MCLGTSVVPYLEGRGALFSVLQGARSSVWLEQPARAEDVIVTVDGRRHDAWRMLDEQRIDFSLEDPETDLPPLGSEVRITYRPRCSVGS